MNQPTRTDVLLHSRDLEVIKLRVVLVQRAHEALQIHLSTVQGFADDDAARGELRLAMIVQRLA